MAAESGNTPAGAGRLHHNGTRGRVHPVID
jgi:hypothetical protein